MPGIASGKHKIFLKELISEFDRIGYLITNPYQVLEASAFGVAQNRKRLILLGSRSDQNPIDYPTATHSNDYLNENLFGDSTKPIIGAEEVIGSLEKCGVNIGKDEPFSLIDYKGIRDTEEYSFRNCHIRTVDNKIHNHMGSKHSRNSIERFESTEQGKTELISRFFKLHPLKPCNTLRAGTNSDHGAHTAPRPIHYKYPRCITVREAARLHSFPDWFHFHKTIWHGFREIGNAVAPLLAKSLGTEIIKNLDYTYDRLSVRTLPKQDEAILSFSMIEACNYWGVERSIEPRKRLH